MSQYASKTTVSVEKSRSEIERLLSRYGADQFISGWNVDKAVIGFTMEQRQIKFLLPLPDRSDPDFTEYKRGYTVHKRTEDAAYKKWEQACRQRWRALTLVIKAKLEAVESGISEFEDEFMANIVMPNGQTVGQMTKPAIEAAYESGQMRPLLPDYS